MTETDGLFVGGGVRGREVEGGEEAFQGEVVFLWYSNISRFQFEGENMGDLLLRM